MGIALDGLVSGLNTTELINALMDVHAIPRNLLSAKSDDRKVIISQLQTLNTSLQELAAKAKKAASGETLKLTGSNAGTVYDLTATVTLSFDEGSEASQGATVDLTKVNVDLQQRLNS